MSKPVANWTKPRSGQHGGHEQRQSDEREQPVAAAEGVGDEERDPDPAAQCDDPAEHRDRFDRAHRPGERRGNGCEERGCEQQDHPVNGTCAEARPDPADPLHEPDHEHQAAQYAGGRAHSTERTDHVDRGNADEHDQVHPGEHRGAPGVRREAQSGWWWRGRRPGGPWGDVEDGHAREEPADRDRATAGHGRAGNRGHTRACLSASSARSPHGRARRRREGRPTRLRAGGAVAPTPFEGATRAARARAPRPLPRRPSRIGRCPAPPGAVPVSGLIVTQLISGPRCLLQRGQLVHQSARPPGPAPP